MIKAEFIHDGGLLVLNHVVNYRDRDTTGEIRRLMDIRTMTILGTITSTITTITKQPIQL